MRALGWTAGLVVGVVVALISVAAPACSFKTPSETGEPGIRDASSSSDVLVIADDGPSPDATIDAADPCAACVTAGGSCANGVCTINSSDSGKVTCPPGLECRVTCSGDANACKDGVDCRLANKCTIACTGDNACRDGDVLCNTNDQPCMVTCTGANACQNHGITCGAGTCNGNCFGDNACQSGGVICGPGICAADCVGDNACQNGSCPVLPALCGRNCCGENACATGTCAGCAITHVGCIGG